jgi:hypothetical protein
MSASQSIFLAIEATVGFHFGRVGRPYEFPHVVVLGNSEKHRGDAHFLVAKAQHGTAFFG